MYFDTVLPIAEYIYSGMWVVATHQTMKFTVVCQDPSQVQDDVMTKPPLGVITLNMSCTASNDYLSLLPFYENKIESHVQDSWGALLKLKNILKFTLWSNFSHSFPNLTHKHFK